MINAHSMGSLKFKIFAVSYSEWLCLWTSRGRRCVRVRARLS